MNYEALLHCYEASMCSMIGSLFQRCQPFWETLMQGAWKQSRFLCLCVDAPWMCNSWWLVSPSYLVQVPLFFSTSLIWMHFTYLAYLEYNEEWQVVKSLKNWKILWSTVSTRIAHSIVRNFHFSTKFLLFLSKWFSLKLPTTWAS
jgi:hypothetical protein